MSDFEDWLSGTTRANNLAEAHAQIAKLRRQISQEKQKTKEITSLQMQTEEALVATLELDRFAEDAPTFSIQPTLSPAKKEGALIALASDWHIEEVVDPATINGVNKYNPYIARARAEQFFIALSWWVDFYTRGGIEITSLTVWWGGDIITGYIHDELMESNEMSPIEATLFGMDIICAGTRYLRQRHPKLEIKYVGSHGNHGRTTAKRKHSTGAKNSYEWLMYNMLRRQFASSSDFSDVTWSIANGAHIYVDIYDWVLRFHHGDDVRFNGGVGGLSIPLHKAVQKWNTVKYADITCIGHYHQLSDFDFAVVNGSLIGYNAFALSIKAAYEPARQGLILIEKDRGKRGVVPLYVDESHRHMPKGRPPIETEFI